MSFGVGMIADRNPRYDLCNCMPRIIEYEQVLTTLTARGMTSLYHNSGSFGFAQNEHICGWIGLPDPTIRDAARPYCANVPTPYMPNLISLLNTAWDKL